MNPVTENPAIISKFTLLVLEYSGWYKVRKKNNFFLFRLTKKTLHRTTLGGKETVVVISRFALKEMSIVQLQRPGRRLVHLIIRARLVARLTHFWIIIAI